jgi:hypothetical protein
MSFGVKGHQKSRIKYLTHSQEVVRIKPEGSFGHVLFVVVLYQLEENPGFR